MSNGTYDQGVYAPGGSAELFISNAGTMKTAYLPLPAGAYVGYNSGGLAWYGHPDWQGTSRLITNPKRQMTLDLAYAPYGDQYVTSGATDTFFTYTGQSAESGDTKTFPARLFHPTQGQWLTPDPAGLSAVDLTNPQTLNRYAYVGGNPMSYVDPSGMRFSLTGAFRDIWGAIQDFFSGDDPCGGNPFCVTTTEASGGYNEGLLFEGGDGGPAGAGPIEGGGYVFTVNSKTGPAKNCSSDLVTKINGFLTSVLPKGNPFLNTGDAMNQNGSAVNVDPRLASSILALESGNGSSYKGNNPFGLGPGLSFKSPVRAIQPEFRVLDNHINNQSQTSVGALYSGQSWIWIDPDKPHWPNNVLSYPGYCGSNSGPAACGQGGATVSNFLTRQGGNPARLNYPCGG